VRQRPQAHAVRGVLEQLFRAREQRQQVDDVLLGLVLDRDMLLRERALQRIAEELRQTLDRNHSTTAVRLPHDFPPRM
jgi:hypothetical protein